MNNITKNTITILIYLLLFTSFLFIVFMCFTFSFQGDEGEHIYNSYRVFNGAIPYKDFFEHHNPVLWFAFSPIFFFFENSIMVYYVARFFMLLCICMTAFYTYKLALLLNLNKNFSLLSAFIYLSFNTVKTVGVQFRPDLPMTLFFIIGTYYLFLFFTDKSKNLSAAFTFYLISFLFLQKILISLIPIFFFLIYYVFTKKISLNCLIDSCLLPLLIIEIFCLFLVYNNTLEPYWIYNYKLNANILDDVPRNYIFFKRILPLSLLSIAINQKNKPLLFLSIYLPIIVPLNIFITSFHAQHYELPFIPFLAIISASLGQQILNRNWLIIIMLLYSFQGVIKQNKNIYINNNHLKSIINLNTFVIQNTSTKDIVLTDYSVSIKKQLVGYYYWFAPKKTVLDMHKAYPIHKLYPLNHYLTYRLPKIIYFDENYERIDMSKIKKYYDIHIFNNRPLFLRK